MLIKKIVVGIDMLREYEKKPKNKNLNKNLTIY